MSKRGGSSCGPSGAEGLSLPGRSAGVGQHLPCPSIRPRAVGPRNVMLPLRLATPGDIPALRELIEQSVRALSVGYYTGPQIESALRYVFGPDTQLIADQTYYVVESETGELVAAGGWSRRRTLYGGDQMKGAEDPLLDPTTEAARIRAFFVR